MFINEGPALYDGVYNEVECRHHAADQTERQEGLEVVPNIPQGDTHGGLRHRSAVPVGAHKQHLDQIARKKGTGMLGWVVGQTVPGC